jgi:5,10-methylenetetrahydrofolate reductase
MTEQPPLTEAITAAAAGGRPFVLCDVSPPRGSALDAMAEIAAIGADAYCCAYAPGRAVRLDSLALAVRLREATGRATAFNLATRDMNVLALANHLLGAEALGQPNVVVVRGDPLTARDQRLIRPVDNLSPTALLTLVTEMNAGRDLRGSALAAATRLCPGATLDLGRGVDQEARLTARKVEAGARFLISQPVAGVEDVRRFAAAYEGATGGPVSVPVLWGIAVPEAGGVALGPMPDGWAEALAAGQDGAALAAGLLTAFAEAGVTRFYLMPPIRRGGARDYAAAARTLRIAFGR